MVLYLLTKSLQVTGPYPNPKPRSFPQEFFIIRREEILEAVLETQVPVRTGSFPLTVRALHLPNLDRVLWLSLTLLTLRCQTGTQGCETFCIRDGCAFPASLAGGPAFLCHPREPLHVPLRAAQSVSSVWRLPLSQVQLGIILCGTLWVPPLL